MLGLLRRGEGGFFRVRWWRMAFLLSLAPWKQPAPAKDSLMRDTWQPAWSAPLMKRTVRRRRHTLSYCSNAAQYEIYRKLQGKTTHGLFVMRPSPLSGNASTTIRLPGTETAPLFHAAIPRGEAMTTS